MSFKTKNRKTQVTLIHVIQNLFDYFQLFIFKDCLKRRECHYYQANNISNLTPPYFLALFLNINQNNSGHTLHLKMIGMRQIPRPFSALIK